MSKARRKQAEKRLEVSGEPVEFWLGRIGETGRATYKSALNLYLGWLRTKPGYENVTPRELLLKHAESDDDYEQLTVLQNYIASLGKSVGYRAKTLRYTAVKSFFAHNRLALPKDPQFKIRKEEGKASVKPKLTIENFRDLVKAANLRDKSILLVKWQSMQDANRLAYLGTECADSIVAQMREGKNPIRIEIPGRKGSDKEYFCYLGKDAIDALRDYFDKERGWPSPGEGLWFKKTRNSKTAGLTTSAFTLIWLRLLRRIGLIPKTKLRQGGRPRVKVEIGGPHTVRYGYGSHELRDLAKSLLHTYGKERGFDLDVAEFWLGHGGQIDKNNYDKFFKDEAYMLKQWTIAEPCLNIISNPLLTATQEEHATEISALRAELNEIKKHNLLRDLLEGYQKAVSTYMSARSGYEDMPSEADAERSNGAVKQLLDEAANLKVPPDEIEKVQREILAGLFKKPEQYEIEELAELKEVVKIIFPEKLVRDYK